MVSQKAALLARPRGLEDTDPRIAVLADMLAMRDAVPYSAHKHFAKMYFMELHDEYYLIHVARYRKHVKELIVAQHYLAVSIEQELRAGRRRARTISARRFIIGVDHDTDALWINRIRFSPAVTNCHNVTWRNGVRVYAVDDTWVKKDIFGYDHDITENTYTIEIPGGALAPLDVLGRIEPRSSSSATYRVQGDLIFRVSRFDPHDVLIQWARGEIDRYIRYLALDKIVAVLRDHGIGVTIATERDNYAALIPGGTNGSRWSEFARRNRERVIKILSTYFSVSADSGRTFTNAWIRDGQIEAWIEIRSVAYFGNPAGDTVVIVRDASAAQIRNMLYEDLLTQFMELRPQDFTRHYGNHVLEFSRAIPVSLVYEPAVKPAVLEPVTLYISARDTYVVDRNTAITARHKDHGTRTVRFAGKYCVRVDFLSTHPMDTVHRNRIALRRADALRLPRPA